MRRHEETPARTTLRIVQREEKPLNLDLLLYRSQKSHEMESKAVKAGCSPSADHGLSGKVGALVWLWALGLGVAEIEA